MFKKPKKNNNITLPAAPSVDEVLSDIETFQAEMVDGCETEVSKTNPTDGWWTAFEKMLQDLKCLEMMHTEIEGYKIKLESLKIEIDTESNLLKNDIQLQQQLIDSALE